MSTITKPSIANNSGISHLFMALFGVLVLPLMLCLLPVHTSALSLNDVTSGINTVITMGKSIPAPVYTPAPSNAPAAATNITAPAATTVSNATTPATTSPTQNTTSGATTGTTAKAAAPSSTTTASTQTNLYKITQLDATQSRLAKNVMHASLTLGVLLILVALMIFGMQFSRARNHLELPIRNQSKAKA